MRFSRIVLRGLAALPVAVTSTMAFSSAVAAQTLAEAFAYTEARKIVEVRVHARSKPGGRGWALTGEERGIEYCYIVTPFHVIGDEVTRTVHSDIVVEGAGYRLKPRAERLADDGRDLALLLLDREGGCPFIDGPSAGSAATGLWLVRLSDTKVREPIAGDARAPIAPASENLDMASLTVAAADRATLTQGWSGASVVRDGRRIGMVVEVADEGATARFYTAQGIFRAFGGQIGIFERAEVSPPPLEDAVRAAAEGTREALSGSFESMDKAVREQFGREAEALRAGRWRGEMMLEEARGPNCARAYAQNMKLDFTVSGDAIAGEAQGRGTARLRFVLDGRLDETGRWSADASEVVYGTRYALALEGALPAGEGTWRDYANGCTGRFTLSRAD